jgi:translation initiation factor IF-3
LAKLDRNKPTAPEHRLNEQIRVVEIRLVGEPEELQEMSQQVGETIDIGIHNTRKVLDWAEKLAIDLIEISPNAAPPVCRLMDYKKFLYDRKKREKEQKAKQVKVVLKEIRFSPNTDDHDFDFKLKHAQNFLEEGSKVKTYVQFKGRAIVFKDRGFDLLKRFLQGLAEFGDPDYPPKLEERRMHCTISPKKVIVPAKKKTEQAEEIKEIPKI